MQKKLLWNCNFIIKKKILYLAINLLWRKKSFFLKLILHLFYTGVWFSIAFLCSIFELSTENMRKNWDRTVLKMWSQNNEKNILLGHKFNLEKKVKKKKNLPLNNFEKKWKVLLFSDIVTDCDMLHVRVLYFLYLLKN